MQYNVVRKRKGIDGPRETVVGAFGVRDDRSIDRLRDAKRTAFSAAVREPHTWFMVEEQQGGERSEADAVLYRVMLNVQDNAPGV